MHEIVDETRGPGRPTVSEMVMHEIWAALGYDDGRVPTLDEVLIEIRDLVRIRSLHHQVKKVPEFPVPEDEEPEEPEEHVIRSVTFGAFGLTITGYSAEDVLKIREAYAYERKEAEK